MIDYFAIAVQNARRQFDPSVLRVIAADAEAMDDAVAVKLDGPRQCCADAGRVIACDGAIDTWECWICGRTWSAPCR